MIGKRYEDEKMNPLFANLRQYQPAKIEASSASRIPYHLILGLIQTFRAERIVFR